MSDTLPTLHLLKVHGNSNSNETFSFTLKETVHSMNILLHESHGKQIVLKHEETPDPILSKRESGSELLKNPPLGVYQITINGTRHLNYAGYSLQVTISSLNFLPSDMKKPNMTPMFDKCLLDFTDCFLPTSNYFLEVEFHEKGITIDHSSVYMLDLSYSKRSLLLDVKPDRIYPYRWRARRGHQSSCWSNYWQVETCKDFNIKMTLGKHDPTVILTLPFHLINPEKRITLFVKQGEKATFKTTRWRSNPFVKHSYEIQTIDYVDPNIDFITKLQIDDIEYVFTGNYRCATPISQVWEFGHTWNFSCPLDSNFKLSVHATGTIEYVEEIWIQDYYGGEIQSYETRFKKFAKLVEIDADHYELRDFEQIPIILERVRGDKFNKWKLIFAGQIYYSAQFFLNFCDWRSKFFENTRFMNLQNVQLHFS